MKCISTSISISISISSTSTSISISTGVSIGTVLVRVWVLKHNNMKQLKYTNTQQTSKQQVNNTMWFEDTAMWAAREAAEWAEEDLKPRQFWIIWYS